MGNFIWIPLISILIVGGLGRYPHITSNRDAVIIENIDINQSLEISENLIQEEKWGRVIGYWVLRDQIIDTSHAKRISDSYFKYIDIIPDHFDKWHFSWAISNFYRNGDDNIKAILKDAYKKSLEVATELNTKPALKHIKGDKIYMGFYHGGGWRGAKNYLVVPGDKRFRQSSEEYLKKHKNVTSK
jgi:hypothetical protein